MVWPRVEVTPHLTLAATRRARAAAAARERGSPFPSGAGPRRAGGGHHLLAPPTAGAGPAFSAQAGLGHGAADADA